MSVYDAGDDDGGQGDAVGDFADERGGGAEGGGVDVPAGEVVDYGRDDCVEGHGCALQEEEGFWVGFGVLELRDEAEEGGVAGCRGVLA